MPRLSEKHRQRIYDAVHEEIMRARIRIARKYPGDAVASDVDAAMSDAGHAAGIAAIRAALGRAAPAEREGE